MSEQVARQLLKITLDLNQALISLLEEREKLQKDDLFGYLDLYGITYDASNNIEKAFKALTAFERDLSYEKITKVMEAKEVPSVRYKGRNFISSFRVFASIPENMRDKGFAWLKDHGLDGIVKETANANTLSSVMSDFIEETGITPPEDVMKLHRQPYIQVRK